MKIRVINQNDWERTYELDKSIVRIGSQISCDIQLTGNDILPMHMQLVRAGGKEIKYILRIFADNVKIARGEQTYPGQQMTPYDVLDGDKILFGSYRMVLSLEDEQTRVRSSENMEAKMYIQKRELSLESPINGVLRLKNTGTERACQFRMQIRGIPDECLSSAPLPYLYPGGKSTVGFMISHLQTKPAPGFHTVSIIISAPDDYFGEVLEFRQDIYVNPVFNNDIKLEDDSDELRGSVKPSEEETAPQKEPVQQPAASFILETARMIPGQPVIEKEYPNDAEKEPIVISGSKNKNAFDKVPEEDDGNEKRRRKSNRKEKITVIHHDDEALKNAFEDEPEVTAEENAEPAPEEVPSVSETTGPAAEPDEAPAKPRRSSARKKKADPEADEKTDEPVEESEKGSAEPELKAAGKSGKAPDEPESKPSEEPEESFSEPEPKPVRRRKKAAAEPEPEPAERPEEPFPEPEPEPAEGPEEPFSEPEPEPAEEPGEPVSVTEPKPAGMRRKAEAETEPEPAEVPEEPFSEPEFVIPAVSEPQTEPEETGGSPEKVEEAAAETESVPEPDTAEEPTRDVPDQFPAEEPEAEEPGSGQERGGSEAEESGPKTEVSNVIPVVYRSDSFDFAGEDGSPEPLPEKEPEVRFVKRGSFDE